MKFFIIPILFLSVQLSAQCKSSIKTTRGETINCIDQKDLKQGKWLIKNEGVRGEPGFDEEGIFKDGKKEGNWRIYSTMGDLLAVENYRWGNKDGVSQYFNIAGLLRQESWKAVNPDNPFDTVDVFDPIDPYKVERKVVRIEGSAVKHGIWKYFESGSGMLLKTENYFLDKIQAPSLFATDGTELNEVDSTQAKPVPKVKPPGVIEFEKKNANKKKIKVIDGRAGN